jgi:outer membrane murein-binding lipoprotein Lpp
MSTIRKLALTAITIVGTTVTAGSLQAQSYEHIDSLALRLRSQTGRLAADLRYHYRHLNQYRHLYRDAVAMYRLADHIHTIVHHGEDLDHVASDVRELDELFHHTEDLVHEIDFHDDHVDFGHWHFGHGHHGHHGHGSLRRLRDRLDSIEDTLHHLSDDID